jgi:hypothetical protein
MRTSNSLEVSVTSGVEQVGYDYFAFFKKKFLMVFSVSKGISVWDMYRQVRIIIIQYLMFHSSAESVL